MARKRKVSYADIEHVEHQIAVLRDRLLQLKVRAMHAGGWKQVGGKDYKGRPLVRWKDPLTGKLYRCWYTAFEIQRRRARKACGPLSCGRAPVSRAILRG